jgi:sulfite reductase (NADPH) flavoprotein alpha-component
MSSGPVIVNVLPENAPFTPEQRIWLSGLFAGLLGLDQQVTPLSPEEAAILVPGLLQPPAGAAAEGPITWHDPGIPITNA